MEEIINLPLIKFYRENNLILPGKIQVMRYHDDNIWHATTCADALFDLEEDCEEGEACELASGSHTTEDHFDFSVIETEELKLNPQSFCIECFDDLYVETDHDDSHMMIYEFDEIIKILLDSAEKHKSREKFSVKVFLKDLEEKHDLIYSGRYSKSLDDARNIIIQSLANVKNLTDTQFQAVKEKELKEAKSGYDKWVKSVLDNLAFNGLTHGAARIKKDMKVKYLPSDKVLFYFERSSRLNAFVKEAYLFSEGYLLMPEDFFTYSLHGASKPSTQDYVKINDEADEKIIETAIKLHSESVSGSSYGDLSQAYLAAKKLA